MNRSKKKTNRYYLVQIRLHGKLIFRRVKSKSEKYIQKKLSKLFHVDKNNVLPSEIPKEIFRWNDELIINL